METNNLTSEEQAYFDSRGETVPPGIVEKEPAPAPETAEADTSTDDTAEIADDTGDDVGEPAKQSMVPHKALHAEREKRKELERKLVEANEFRIRIEERQRYIAEQDAAKAKAATPEPETVPDPDEDVFAATKYALKQQDEIKQRLDEQARQQQEEAGLRDAVTRVQAHENEFRKATPDYDNAITFIRDSRDKELEKVWGIKDPGQRSAIIQREALQIAQSALRQNRSPAEVAYEAAQARGYRPPAAVTEAADGDERIERAKVASKSLSNAGGAPTGPMTAERLAKMSMKEFTAYEAKNPDTVRRLMGG